MARRADAEATIPSSADSDTPNDQMPFEEALEALERLVAELEGGEFDLERSLRTFEAGVRLVRHCSDQLRSAEVRIRQLEEGPDGLRELRSSSASSVPLW